MDGRNIEPRRAMWAVAEISWQDATGTSFRAPATLEDTSSSGACLRVQQPFQVGSRLTVKWHREQFAAVARNCHREGRDFLLGVRREQGDLQPQVPFPTPGTTSAPKAEAALPAEQAEPTEATASHTPSAAPVFSIQTRSTEASVLNRPAERMVVNSPRDAYGHELKRRLRQSGEISTSSPHGPPFEFRSSATFPRSERKAMQPKTLFTQFWRRDEDAPAKLTSTEAPVNKPANHASEAPSGQRGDLLSYEDIYRAAGILSPGSGYGIHKVVEMLNSERIRDLSKDVKRSSVLMALDAAGISVDDLLTDATRRQNALTSYESGQRKQLEDFESRKAQENARIEEEMEKIRAHYAARVQSNLDQVAKEKDALRNWQMAMQCESQRIAEVLELCGKQPATRPGNAMAASAGAQGSEKGQSLSADSPQSLRPSLLGKD